MAGDDESENITTETTVQIGLARFNGSQEIEEIDVDGYSRITKTTDDCWANEQKIKAIVSDIEFSEAPIDWGEIEMVLVKVMNGTGFVGLDSGVYVPEGKKMSVDNMMFEFYWTDLEAVEQAVYNY